MRAWRGGSGNKLGYEPSITLPDVTYWKSDEKGRFYAALARHSRLRPDLIARDVRTKREHEVVQFIYLLETQSAQRGDRKNLNFESQEWRDHLMWSGAYEAPQAIGDDEERLAELLRRTDNFAQLQPDSFHKMERRKSLPMSSFNRHFAEVWGKQFTTSNMDIVADILHLSSVAPTGSPPPEDETEEDAIARDNEQIDLILDIPKKDRTPAEKSNLQMLTNRRRMRQQYRRRRLRARGWTDEEIDNKGGPDAVFIGLQPGGAKRKGKAARMEEANPLLFYLQQFKIDHYLENRGWELFNFDGMAQLIDLYQKAYGVTSEEASGGTSFALIDAMYNMLHKFLKILIGKLVIFTKGQDSRATEISEEQIVSVLDLFGLPDSGGVLRRSVTEFHRLSGMAERREAAGDEPESRKDASEDVAAPEGEPHNPYARDPESAKVVRRRDRHHVPVLPISQMAPLPPNIRDPPPDEDVWLPVCTETDDEDEALDDKLEAVDTALDVVMGYQLQGAAHSTSTGINLDDHVWSDARGTRGRGWQQTRAAIPVPPEAKARLREAQRGETASRAWRKLTEAYRDLMTKVTAARRHRRLMAERTKRFPTKQARKRAAHFRRAIPEHVLAMEYQMDAEDNALVDTSSEESDGQDGVGTPRRSARAPMSSDDEDDWEASGDSSGAYSSDEAPGSAVIILSRDSDEDAMDVDATPDVGDTFDGDADELPLKVLGGDDVLDSDSAVGEVAMEGAGVLGGDDALDSDSDDGMAIYPLGGGDALDTDSDDEAARKPTPEASSSEEALVRGDDALASDKEVERGDGSVEVLSGDDALDSEGDESHADGSAEDDDEDPAGRSAEGLVGDHTLDSASEAPALPSPRVNGYRDLSTFKSPPRVNGNLSPEQTSSAPTSPTQRWPPPPPNGHAEASPQRHPASSDVQRFTAKYGRVLTPDPSNSDHSDHSDQDSDIDVRVRALSAQPPSGSEDESERSAGAGGEPEAEAAARDESDEGEAAGDESEDEGVPVINGQAYSDQSRSPSHASGREGSEAPSEGSANRRETWLLGGDDALDSDSD